MNVRMNDQKIEWMIELTLEWTKEKEQMIEWTLELMNEWYNEC